MHNKTDQFICYLQLFFLRQHSPKDKYLILLKSNSHCLKLFCKTNNSTNQPVFITKTCFLYQTVCANSATFTVQYTLYCWYLPEIQYSKSIFLFVNYFFQNKRTDRSISKFSSQIFNKKSFGLTKIDRRANINITIVKEFKLCKSYNLMFSFKSRTTWRRPLPYYL